MNYLENFGVTWKPLYLLMYKSSISQVHNLSFSNINAVLVLKKIEVDHSSFVKLL